MVSQWNSSEILSQDSPHCSSATKSKSSSNTKVYVYIHLSHAPTATCQHHPSGNTSCALSYYSQESTALAGTHNPVGADPRAGTGLVLPMVKLGQSKPDGLGHIGTADSDLMHHQYRLCVLQWNPGPTRRNTTNIIAAACGRFMRLFFKKLVIMFRTSPISSYCAYWCACLQGRLHKRRYLGHGHAHRSRTAAPPLTFRDTNGHILLSTHSQCRCQETLRIH